MNFNSEINVGIFSISISCYHRFDTYWIEMHFLSCWFGRCICVSELFYFVYYVFCPLLLIFSFIFDLMLCFDILSLMKFQVYFFSSNIAILFIFLQHRIFTCPKVPYICTSWYHTYMHLDFITDDSKLDLFAKLEEQDEASNLIDWLFYCVIYVF